MDDVLLNKAGNIERCIKRIESLYLGFQQEIQNIKHDHQDAIVLNILRACESSVDGAMHLVRIKKLGVYQNSGDALELTYGHEIITEA